jgi:hypothetical protein
VELAALKEGNKFIVELLADFEVLLRKLPKWYDKIWFRYAPPPPLGASIQHSSEFNPSYGHRSRRRRRIVTSVSLEIISKWLRKCGHASTKTSELKSLRREKMRKDRRTARESLLTEFLQPVNRRGSGAEYVQDNWVNIPKTMTKRDFEARRPAEGEEMVLKEVRSVFTSDEQREQAVKKLERFREGIKKSLQSEMIQSGKTIGKGKERV